MTLENSEVATELENATRKADQLPESVQSVEEKVSNSESEIQELRQQDMTLAALEPDSEEEYLIENQQENEDLQNLGYAGDEPEAACVFDHIIDTLASASDVPLNDNEVLVHWLSNSVTLVLLLHRTLNEPEAANLPPQRRRNKSASLFARILQGLQSSPQNARISFPNSQGVAKLDNMRQVEEKYPALLFKQQLTAFVKKIYGMIRDNLKEEISPLLGLCIQAPRTSRASLANAVAQQDLIAHWQSIRESLNTYLNLMKANHVPPFLVRKVFTQIFSFINVELFNSLLRHRECCSFSKGESFTAGLAELEKWCIEATEEFSGTAWDELSHIRQAVGFLVTHQKEEKTLHEITRNLCRVLSIHQLYKITTMYWDDKNGSLSFSPDVIAKMRVMMTEESKYTVSSSFLLEDDLSIPFTVEDISKSMQEVDVIDIELIRAFNLVTGVTELEEEKAQEYARQQEALQTIRLQVEEANAAVNREREAARKAIEEINSLTSEVEAQKTELEEEKAQEYARQQEDLQTMRLQVEEANAAVIREREVARKAIEEINSLTSDVEALKALLQSEQQAAENLKKAFSEAEARNLELATELENSTRKADQLHKSVQRLEEKLSNSKSEIQVLLQQTENQDLLVKCISQNLGYAGGKPVAACVIYKCLRHWRLFEVEETSLIDRIIQTITSAIEVPDNNEILAYWLSNSVTLLPLLHRLRNKTNTAKQTRPPRFRMQLATLIKKIYGMIRDNFKNDISLSVDCQSVIESLNAYLNLMKANHVPPFLVRKGFTQIFSFINVEVFNSFLLRREGCSLRNEELGEATLAELEKWCAEATEEFCGTSWDELSHIRQAAGFLVITKNYGITLEKITRDLCPVLSIQQLYRICTMNWDDKNNTRNVSSEVIAEIKAMMTEDSDDCLLAYDSRIPFTVEDISKLMQDVDVSDIEPAQLILEILGFGFLITS